MILDGASYLLYGNPTVCYFKKDQNTVRENNKQQININEISSKELKQPDEIYKKKSDLRSRWSKSDQSSINIKITKKELLLFIIISIAAIYMLFANITNQDNNIKDQIPKNIKITLEKNADIKQKNFLNLFEKYKQLVKPDVNDQWTSAKVAIFTGNISKNKENEDIMVLDALTKKIIDSKLNIDVIQRGESFEEIFLPEKVKNLELEGYNKINRAKQTILKAKLVLIINMINYSDKFLWLFNKEKKVISMRLVEIESDKILNIFYENINADLPFFSNKKLFDELIPELKKNNTFISYKGDYLFSKPKINKNEYW